MPPELLEKEINPNVIKFQILSDLFIAEKITFVISESPLIDNSNAGKWNLKRASYHTHRKGKPIKAKRSQQRPRWKNLGFFDDLESIREFIRKESDERKTNLI